MAVDQFTAESLPFTHPLFLHPSDTQRPTIVDLVLTGVDNYSVWSRAMKNALRGKHKLGFIDGTCQKASQESRLQDQWERCDAVVLSWIINSISKELTNGEIVFDNAHHAWNDLKDRFDKKTGSRDFALFCEISSYRQGSSSVTSYFSKLEELWEEQSAVLAIPMCSEQHKLFQFLMGLNDSYGQARSQILLMQPLPSVNEAYKMIIQDKTQKSIAVNNRNSSSEGIAMAVKGRGRGRGKGRGDNALESTYCQEKGHTRDTCYQLIGYPPHLKNRLQQNKDPNQIAEDSSLDTDGSNNNVTTVALALTHAQYQQLLELLKKDTEPPVHALTATETMNHPRHCCPLRLKGEEGNPFQCCGCKDLGFGPRYQCEKNNCSFFLHEECFKARDTDPSKTHPFMSDCRFQFVWEPPGGPNHRLCDACRQDVRGFLYHDKEKGLDLHPCCMNLESTICDPSGTMKLILTDNAPSKCVKCQIDKNRKPYKGWSYVSSCGKYSYHVYCVKKLIIDNWERGYFNVASSRDITASSSTSSSLSLARKPSTSRPTRWLIKIAKVGFSVILSVLLGSPTPLFTALAEKLLD